MGILLIIPQNPATTGIVSQAYGVTGPLGVGYIAGYLKKHNFDVSILDNNIERLSREDFRTYLRKIKPGYIGLSLLTSAVNNALSFAAAAKEVNSQIKVIAGGPHASALPQDVLGHEAIDVVVKGEG
ncbi:MAG: cobalamin-dependent protein, partial [Candidatus Omnitrophota bacterium]